MAGRTSLVLAAACLLLCAGAQGRTLLQYDCATAEVDCLTALKGCTGKMEFKCVPATAKNTCFCVSGGLAGCFPGAATVRVSTGEVKLMSDLELGEAVLTVGGGGLLQYSPMFMWSSRRPGVKTAFLRVFTDAGVNVTVTPGHYLFAWQGDGAEQAAAAMLNTTVAWPYVLPTKLKVGDVVPVAAAGAPGGSGSAALATLARVTAVEEVQEEGVFMPHTRTGAIVVDGVVASELTNLVPGMLADNRLSRTLTIVLSYAYHMIPGGGAIINFVLGQMTYWAHGVTDGAIDFDALFGEVGSAA